MNQASAERSRALFTSYYKRALSTIVVKANTAALLRCLASATAAAKGAQQQRAAGITERQAAQYGNRDNAAHQPFVRPAPPTSIPRGHNLINRASDAHAPHDGHDDPLGQDGTPVCEAAHLIAASLGHLSVDEAQQVNDDDAHNASQQARGRLRHATTTADTCAGGCGRAPDRCSCGRCRRCAYALHVCICEAEEVQEHDSPASPSPRTAGALQALQEMMQGDTREANNVCPLAKRAAEFGRLASGRASTPGVTPAAVVTIWRQDPATNPRATPAVAWLQFHPFPATFAPLAAAALLTGGPVQRDAQPGTYTAWSVTWASECADSWHSHLPPHPSRLLVVAHDGRAVLVPFRSAAAAWGTGSEEDANSTKTDRVRREAEAVWWRNSDQMGRDDPTNRVWGEQLQQPQPQQQCPHCRVTLASTFRLQQHLDAGCETALHTRTYVQQKKQEMQAITTEARTNPRRSARHTGERSGPATQ